MEVDGGTSTLLCAKLSSKIQFLVNFKNFMYIQSFCKMLTFLVVTKYQMFHSTQPYIVEDYLNIKKFLLLEGISIFFQGMHLISTAFVIIQGIFWQYF